MKEALSSVALQEIIPAVLPSSELHVSAPATKRWRTVPKLVASTSFIHLSAQLVKATCETLSPLLVKRRKKLSLIAAGVESPDRTGPTIADEEAEV